MRLIKTILALVILYWLFGESIYQPSPSCSTPHTLRLAHYGNYQDYQTWRKIIDLFQQQHPEITIHQEYFPGFGGEYDSKLQRQFLAGLPPDLFLLQDETLPQYAGQYLQPLANLFSSGELKQLEQSWLTTARDSFNRRGIQYGIPMHGGCLLIYVNLRCVQRAEQFHQHPIQPPPKEWSLNDFVQFAKLLTIDEDGDGRREQYGFWHPRWGYFQPFIWSMGADFFDEQSDCWTMTGPAAEQAWQLYRDMLLVENICPAPGELGQIRQDIAFLNGRVAMVINGPWFLPLVESTSLRDQYLLASIPRGPAGRWTRLTWDGIVVRHDLPSEKLAAVRTFLLFLNAPEVQQIILSSSRFFPPTLPSPVESNHLQGLEAFLEALPYARLQKITPQWKEINRLINRRLYPLLAGKITVKEFLEQLANESAIRELCGPL